ncbi:MAG: hypothetical protein KF735_18330 [Chelatococcus sp.]|uniref:hypothetical protein n=1 Tax=Chelatococcus sp. TaxID=1953771 RepID=UPI0025B8DFE2|nr:hypothetical protein [Chelatococcus sp.]MBX3539603.1 hypothetical protein [Chelatococcus sp.]
MFRQIIGSAVGCVLVLGSPLAMTSALADKASATACAAKLGKPGQIIYNKVAPQAAATADLRGLITDETRSLVMSGQVSRGDARPAAEAAGACLVQLRS